MNFLERYRMSNIPEYVEATEAAITQLLCPQPHSKSRPLRRGHRLQLVAVVWEPSVPLQTVEATQRRLEMATREPSGRSDPRWTAPQYPRSRPGLTGLVPRLAIVVVVGQHLRRFFGMQIVLHGVGATRMQPLLRWAPLHTPDRRQSERSLWPLRLCRRRHCC